MTSPRIKVTSLSRYILNVTKPLAADISSLKPEDSERAKTLVGEWDTALATHCYINPNCEFSETDLSNAMTTISSFGLIKFTDKLYEYNKLPLAQLLQLYFDSIGHIGIHSLKKAPVEHLRREFGDKIMVLIDQELTKVERLVDDDATYDDGVGSIAVINHSIMRHFNDLAQNVLPDKLLPAIRKILVLFSEKHKLFANKLYDDLYTIVYKKTNQNYLFLASIISAGLNPFAIFSVKTADNASQICQNFLHACAYTHNDELCAIFFPHEPEEYSIHIDIPCYSNGVQSEYMLGFGLANGGTPLIVAAYQNAVDVAARLLAHKANINARIEVDFLQQNFPQLTFIEPPARGETALNLAASCGHWQMIELLIAHHADLFIIGNYYKKTALEIARTNKMSVKGTKAEKDFAKTVMLLEKAHLLKYLQQVLAEMKGEFVHHKINLVTLIDEYKKLKGFYTQDRSLSLQKQYLTLSKRYHHLHPYITQEILLEGEFLKNILRKKHASNNGAKLHDIIITLFQENYLATKAPRPASASPEPTLIEATVAVADATPSQVTPSIVSSSSSPKIKKLRNKTKNKRRQTSAPLSEACMASLLSADQATQPNAAVVTEPNPEPNLFEKLYQFTKAYPRTFFSKPLEENLFYTREDQHQIIETRRMVDKLTR